MELFVFLCLYGTVFYQALKRAVYVINLSYGLLQRLDARLEQRTSKFVRRCVHKPRI